MISFVVRRDIAFGVFCCIGVFSCLMVIAEEYILGRYKIGLERLGLVEFGNWAT